MYDFSSTVLAQLSVHKVGNKAQNEGLTLSERSVEIDEDISTLLMHYFLKPFKPDQWFQFWHEADLDRNEVYQSAQNIFKNPAGLNNESQTIAKRLYEKSDHPKIKAGELYVAHFKNCKVDGQECNAIGLFKSENKETYLKVYDQGGDLEIGKEDGININKLDKGCLIFDLEMEDGYIIAAVDKTNSNDAIYWKDEFLKILPREDNYFYTQNFMDAFQNYTERATAYEDGTYDRKEQIVMMNRAVNYFTETEVFQQQEFEDEVLGKKDLIEDFGTYIGAVNEHTEMFTAQNFPINDAAVKKKKRYLKHKIKLDKNFHIYIHGDENRIERGYDEEKGLNFYKVYFNEED